MAAAKEKQNEGFTAIKMNGTTINEEKVMEMAKIGHDWKNPVWRNEDGSVAEW